jgi:diguanylate cyclase (GGDEF)-like protein
VDLDRFKEVNDNHGHAIGDRVLQEVSERIRSCVRESDTVGRVGGDEFVITLYDVGDRQGAVTVAERIRGALGRPFEIRGLELQVSASIGMALYPDHGDDPTELSRHADEAMYEAKKAGRDRVVVYENGITNPEPRHTP